MEFESWLREHENYKSTNNSIDNILELAIKLLVEQDSSEQDANPAIECIINTKLKVNEEISLVKA